MPGHVPEVAAARTPACVLDKRIGANHAPPRQLHAKTQVNIFAIHVIALVEAFDRGVGFAAQQLKGGVDPVRRRPRRHLVLAAQQVARQQARGRGHEALVILHAAGGVALGRAVGAGSAVGVLASRASGWLPAGVVKGVGTKGGGGSAGPPRWA